MERLNREKGLDMETYRIWNLRKTMDFETFEEAVEEAKKRAKKNKYGCDIYLYDSETGTMTHVKTVTK